MKLSVYIRIHFKKAYSNHRSKLTKPFNEPVIVVMLELKIHYTANLIIGIKQCVGLEKSFGKLNKWICALFYAQIQDRYVMFLLIAEKTVIASVLLKQ